MYTYMYMFICSYVHVYIYMYHVSKQTLVHTLVLMQMALDLTSRPPSLESAPHARLISIEKKPGERLKEDPYRILPSTDSVTP